MSHQDVLQINMGTLLPGMDLKEFIPMLEANIEGAGDVKRD